MVQTSLVEKITEEIRAGIQDGLYSPGQRLIEGNLSRTLKVSRGPIREAIRLLAAEGVVQIEPNRGAAVRKPTRREVADIYQMREVNEGLAARLATGNATSPRARRRIEAMLAEILELRESENYSTHPIHNRQFHGLLIELSDNKELAALINRLLLPILYLQFRALNPKTIVRALEAHEVITRAVLDGDANRAERFMRRHIKGAITAIEKVPDAYFGIEEAG